MTTAKHTQGQWKVSGQVGYAGFRVVDDKGRSVAAFPSTSTRPDPERDANARLIAAAPELLAYAECEEAKRISLLPSNKGGSGNSQSYMETFNKYGWNGRDVYGFLDKLRRDAIAKAKGI